MKKLYRKPTGKRRSSAAVDDLMDHVRADVDRELNELGAAVYGDKWPAVLAHNAQRMTGGEGELTLNEKRKLLDGLKRQKGCM